MKQIIGYHLSHNITACSDGTFVEGNNAEEHLNLLCKYPNDSICVFWHLNYATALICKLLNLTKEQGEILLKTGDLRLPYKYILKYIPGKFFSIRNGTFFRAPLSMFSDMSQFNDCVFQEHDTLEDCLKKAIEAKTLGEKTLAVSGKLGITPSTLTSPIRIFEKVYIGKYDEKGNVKPKGIDIPTTDDYPEDIAQDLAYTAYGCIHGGWVESFFKGHFPNSADYDISSAYSFYEAQLLDLRYGEWRVSKEYDEKADYGFCVADLNIKSSFHPILYNIDVENHFTPIGFYKDYPISKKEIDLIHKYKLGTVNIKQGYWWRCKRPYKPLSSAIGWLMTLKNQYTDFDKEFIKRVLNGMWGIMLQIKRDEQVGEHFNPVWGALVETDCRLAVYEFCLKVMAENVKILHIAVDGVLTDKPVSFVNPLAPKTPGTWRQETNCPSLVISSGCVALRDKLGKGEFGMDYDWLVDQIKSNPKSSEYPETKWSPYTLAKAINENDFGKIGEITRLTKTIDIFSDVKRQYPIEPKNGLDLLNNIYESVPLDTGALHGMILPSLDNMQEGNYDS
jgi:hypothetical protein